VLRLANRLPPLKAAITRQLTDLPARRQVDRAQGAQP
jgi:hypothetical protein